MRPLSDSCAEPIIIEPETGDAEAPARPPTKIDFAERDARNRKLGRSGESWVVELEKRTLINAGRKDLAERVDWVSDRLGDGLGYDIVSSDELGADKFIEVKTTNARTTVVCRKRSQQLPVLSQ